jgi:preprotein translocase subunit YajC
MFFMFISQAWAQATSAATTAAATTGATPTGMASTFASLMPLLLIFLVFYFLVIRPQSKRMRTHQDMLQQLKKGDKVVTGGGILGTVVAVDTNDVITVEVAENVRVQALKHTLTGLQAMAAPANDTGAKKKTTAKK